MPNLETSRCSWISLGSNSLPFCSADFSSNLRSEAPDSVPADWAETRCLWRAGYVFAGLGGWVLEETVKSRICCRDEHTRCFQLCCEGCLALGDGDTVEMRQFLHVQMSGKCSALLWHRAWERWVFAWERGQKSCLLLEKQYPVHHGGSAGGCVAPPEDRKLSVSSRSTRFSQQCCQSCCLPPLPNPSLPIPRAFPTKYS